jgi:hypothetical protein
VILVRAGTRAHVLELAARADTARLEYDGTVKLEANPAMSPPSTELPTCRAFAAEETTFSVIVRCLQFFLAPWNLQGTNPDPARAPDVINNSWGTLTDVSILRLAFDHLYAAGIYSVAAAGNFGPFCGSITIPGAYKTVTAVGALTEKTNNMITFFSSEGPGSKKSARQKPDLVAPGEFI